MARKEIDIIYFRNDTDLPVIVEGWQNKMSGLSSLVSTKVEPKQEVIVHSTTGEWYMNSMFFNSEDQKCWKGLEKHHVLGKFRSRPCAMMNYSWLEYDEPFRCVYSELEKIEEAEASENKKNKAKGKITFSMA